MKNIGKTKNSFVDISTQNDVKKLKHEKHVKTEKSCNVGIGMYLGKHKIALSIYIFCVLLSSVVTFVMTIMSANLIVYITDFKNSYHQAIHLGIVVLIVAVCHLCLTYLQAYLYKILSSKVCAELNHDLADRAFLLTSQTYSDHNTGTFVQRIVNEPEAVVNNLDEMLNLMVDAITNLVMMIYVASLNIVLGIIIFSIEIIGLVIETFRIIVRRKLRQELKTESDKIHSITTEIVRSEKDIKSLGLENQLSEISNKQYQSYNKAKFKTNMTDYRFWWVRKVLCTIGMYGLLLLGITMMDKGSLTLATYMILYSNKNYINEFVWSLGNIANRIVDIRISLSRMFALFENDEFKIENFGNVTLPNTKRGGAIEFKNVEYTYYTYKLDEKTKFSRKHKFDLIATKNVLKDLSFKIKPNTTVAFVGKSGSGKSTILNLISKLYEVESGEVLIDGVNINDLTKESLRTTISLVNQFPYIFDMTIKDNLLTAKKDATDEEIDLAIKNSYLDEFISSLPEGLNTFVGESGIKLSGGQKQRLAIARAMLRNSKIIIFDESTSSLDNFAQNHVKHSIDNLKGKTTVIMVAHRLSTIKDVDKIFFLDGGKIVDSGSFDKLITKNAEFRDMFMSENVK